MRFLVDNIRKIIFGWSAKCGCSHIKYIFWFLQNNNIDNRNEKDNKIQTEKGTIFFTEVEKENLMKKNKTDKGLEEKDTHKTGNLVQKGNLKLDMNMIENEEIKKYKSNYCVLVR